MMIMLNWHTPDNTLLVADYDRTMSHWTPWCISAFWVFPRTPWASDQIQRRAKELFAHYYPIETDPHLDETERKKHMKIWNQEVMEVLGDHIDEEQYERVMQFAIENMLLRDGIKDFFLQMSDNGVPIIIFSAWVTNVIQRVLDANGVPYDWIHGNELWFQDGRLELINKWVYIWEKNWHSLPKWVKDIWSDRTHKLLLWDSLDDLNMWDPDRTITSIWFLTSEKIDKGHSASYRENFHHVIESDVCDKWVLERIQKQLMS